MTKLFRLEDDIGLVSGRTFALEKQGYTLAGARTLAEADTLWAAGPYDLPGPDVSLADGSGFSFCQEARQTSQAPILILTAKEGITMKGLLQGRNSVKKFLPSAFVISRND